MAKATQEVVGSIAARVGATRRINAFMYAPEDLTVVVDPAHELYDERVKLPLDENLVRSIMHQGVLVPLIVRKNGELRGGKSVIEVVDGRQRARAAIEANLRLEAMGRDALLVPATLRRGDGADLFGVSITANALRKGDTLLVRARAMVKLQNFGKSDEEVAVIFGVSESTVRSTVALLSCAKEVQRAVETRAISAVTARKLAVMPKAEQVEELRKLEGTGATKGKAAAASVDAAAEGRGKPRKPFRMAMRTRKEVSAMLAIAVDASEKANAVTVERFDVAVAMLRWMLGEADAFNDDLELSKLEDTLERSSVGRAHTAAKKPAKKAKAAA